MYDWKVGAVGAVGLNHIRTPCVWPSGSLKDTYQYEPGGCGFMPGSVFSWNRSLIGPLLAEVCESQKDFRSVPAVPVVLSPLASVRMRAPGAEHGSAAGGREHRAVAVDLVARDRGAVVVRLLPREHVLCATCLARQKRCSGHAGRVELHVQTLPADLAGDR